MFLTLPSKAAIIWDHQETFENQAEAVHLVFNNVCGDVEFSSFKFEHAVMSLGPAILDLECNWNNLANRKMLSLRKLKLGEVVAFKSLLKLEV